MIVVVISSCEQLRSTWPPAATLEYGCLERRRCQRNAAPRTLQSCGCLGRRQATTPRPVTTPSPQGAAQRCSRNAIQRSSTGANGDTAEGPRSLRVRSHCLQSPTAGTAARRIGRSNAAIAQRLRAAPAALAGRTQAYLVEPQPSLVQEFRGQHRKRHAWRYIARVRLLSGRLPLNASSLCHATRCRASHPRRCSRRLAPERIAVLSDAVLAVRSDFSELRDSPVSRNCALRFNMNATRIGDRL